MARVLWVTDEPPDRSLGGGNIRGAHLLLGLSAQHDVTLVVAGGGGEALVRSSVRRVVDVPAVATPAGGSSRRAGSALLAAFTRAGPAEVLAARASREALVPVVRELEGEHDITVTNHLGLVPLVEHHRRSVWLAQLYHLPSVQLRQRAAVARGRLRLRLAAEARRARHWERVAATRADGVVVVSDDDGRTMRDIGARTVVVSPNGVDVDGFAGGPVPADPVVAFTGTLMFPPNVDAAVWLAGEIWPAVRSSVPDARLVIAGRAPVPVVGALHGRDGIEVHGDVPDVVPHLHGARVAVVPLRAGTGTRLKVLEAMAAGRPVVGTTVGLEGFGLRHREHAWIADTADGIAEGVIALLRDDALAEQLAAASREVARAHDWAVVADRLSAELAAILAAR